MGEKSSDPVVDRQVDRQPEEGGSESLRTVLIALAANGAIAIAKTAVAALTGSASMVAEAAHSWADTGNEIFLLQAERRGDRAPDESHPLGYGRAAFVWAMIAGFGLFAVGSALSISHGISQLGSNDPGQDYGIAYAVLAVSFVLEGVSFIQAWRQVGSSAQRWGIGRWRYMARTSETTVRSVFLEDLSALIGIVLAAAGLYLHQVTGKAVYDAVGSILVGVLLGVVAVFLIRRNAEFLVGTPGASPARAVIVDALRAEPEIERVTFLHLEYVGPSKLLVIASVDLVGDLPEGVLAQRVQAIENRMNELDLVARCVLTLASPRDTGNLPEFNADASQASA